MSIFKQRFVTDISLALPRVFPEGQDPPHLFRRLRPHHDRVRGSDTRLLKRGQRKVLVLDFDCGSDTNRRFRNLKRTLTFNFSTFFVPRFNVSKSSQRQI